MKQTPFEKYGGTYTQQGDYLLPDIKLPEQHPKQSGGNHQCQANLCITIWQGGAVRFIHDFCVLSDSGKRL